MNTHNLIDVLKTFSAKELKEFRKFLKSPFFNKRNAVVNLYDIIVKSYPGFEGDSLSKEKIFNKLFTKNKYKDNTLRVLMHYLTELAEKFLAHNRLETDDLEYSVLLQNELRGRKLFKRVEKNIKRSASYLQDRDLDAEDYSFYKYRLENEKTSYLYESHYAFYEKIINTSDWENVFKDFTIYYHIKSMLMYLNSLSIHRSYNKDFKSETYTDMIRKIDPGDYEDVPTIKIYYYILKMITDMNEELHFYKVKELVQKNKSILNKFDLMGAYIYLNQYCLKKIADGVSKFEKESFEIYKEEIQEKTYQMNDGTMAPIFYRNVVNAGLTLKELSWVKNFIEEYKSELPKRYRDNYFHYCLALYEFHAGNFELSIVLNSKIKYDEVYMKLNSKTLQMQLLFETKGEESLLDSLESFRHFLINNKLIPDNKKLLFTNFHKY